MNLFSKSFLLKNFCIWQYIWSEWTDPPCDLILWGPCSIYGLLERNHTNTYLPLNSHFPVITGDPLLTIKLLERTQDSPNVGFIVKTQLKIQHSPFRSDTRHQSNYHRQRNVSECPLLVLYLICARWEWIHFMWHASYSRLFWPIVLTSLVLAFTRKVHM